VNGILIIDKPQDFTSHDVVARCRRILRTKSIGHTGTLDPFATGVMVLLVGKATRLAQFLDKDAKEYEATARFGFETTTGDRTGERKEGEKGRRGKGEKISVEEIERVLEKFRGEILQTPPMFSAKKVAGKKLYELARKGVEIERKPVAVKIYDLELIKSGQRSVVGGQKKIADHRPLTTDHSIRVSCSAGTYIRVLAEDIGRALGVGAHLAELRRTKAGKFDLSKAVTLEELEKIIAENRLETVLISMNEALSHLPEKILDETELQKIKNGMRLRFETTEIDDDQPVRLSDAGGDLAAVGIFNKSEKTIQPKIVLV
jgi:tRNA pseudouridine55 synthase